jgi:branched-chain amino acid transport system ATP-binding protein
VRPARNRLPAFGAVRIRGALVLSFEKVDVFLGPAQILFGLTLAVGAGEAAVLVGRNGAGKSTTLKTAIGLVRSGAGRILFNGRRIESLACWEIASLGLGYVPEERRIFSDLTVQENLEVGRLAAPPGAVPWTPERLFSLFPSLAPLKTRRALNLSGGEQQMLTIARTLMGNPRCLLLDEPSEGLAPVVVEQLALALRALKQEGIAMLLSEQNLRFAAAVADHAHIIEKGFIRYSGPVAELAGNEALRATYLAF